MLDVRDVHMRFGGLFALTDVSLRVDEHSVTGVIGANGAGKTTLFNVICGLQKPSGGVVTLEGRDITRLPAHRRARLGLRRSFQNLGANMNRSVLEHLMAAQHLSFDYRATDLVLRSRRCSMIEREARARVADSAREFGLENRLDARMCDLSFAGARLAELAGLFAQKPRIVLLDEPTTGLDPHEIDVLAGAVRDLRSAGTTVLLVAHDVQFVSDVCDTVHAMAEGRVIASGTAAHVTSHPLVVESYLGAGR
jgi:branched-chain amino acid transport system ATP-binding protein